MVIEKANSEYSTCRIPVLVMMKSGDLLACYECRKDFSDWAEIDLKIIKSTDGGNTWQTLHLIKGNGNTLNNPVFIVAVPFPVLGADEVTKVVADLFSR